MKKTILTLLALVASISFALAEEVFDFTYSLPAGWTATVAPDRFEGGDGGRGAQFASSSTLTLPGAIDVKEVTVVCSTNTETDNENSIEVTVGGQTFGTKKLPKANGQTLVFTYTEAKSGDLNIIITKPGKKKSVWIKTVRIDGTFDKSILPEEDPMEGLDKDYQYEEPTTVISEDTLGSKIPYEFIYNNVKVIATRGTKTQYYFGANADSKLTFVTTRKMKAIVVDGFVRKAFSASASSGTLAYMSSGAVDLDADQILAVTDIDSTILTIQCNAQLRCYRVYVYFESNPEIDIQPIEEEGYSYNDETAEVSTIDITFTDIKVDDMSDDLPYACTSLELKNEEYELELWVFTATVEGTILPVGTYPIQQQPEGSQIANTIMASLGGTEDYDLPSYLITDLDYDEVNDVLTYNKVYYLVSGSMEVLALEGGVYMNIQATTAKGSTIKAKYIKGEGEPIVEDAIDNTVTTIKAVKMLRDGQLLIQRNGAIYHIDGRPL